MANLVPATPLTLPDCSNVSMRTIAGKRDHHHRRARAVVRGQFVIVLEGQ